MKNQLRELQLFPVVPVSMANSNHGYTNGSGCFGSEVPILAQSGHLGVGKSFIMSRVPASRGNAGDLRYDDDNFPASIAKSDEYANQFHRFGSNVLYTCGEEFVNKSKVAVAGEFAKESKAAVQIQKSDEHIKRFNLSGSQETYPGAGDLVNKRKFSIHTNKSVDDDCYENSSNSLVSNNKRIRKVCDQSKHSGSGNIGQTEREKSPISDCESGISGTSNQEKTPSIVDGLIKVSEDERPYLMIKHKFISGLGNLGAHTRIDAIRRIGFSGVTRQARLQTFLIYSKAVEKKCGGNANVKYAWFGASKDEISNIIEHGFSLQGESENNGIHLCADGNPLQSMKSSIVDESGLRHVLLCRVITGKMELVHPGSGKYHPSSGEFDIGVDDLLNPNKYFVWTAQLGSHVLPEFVISFRVPPNMEACNFESQVLVKKPISPWMPFSILIYELSKFLPTCTAKEIRKYHSDQREKKITRHELIHHLRRVAGDKLLASVIKSYVGKQQRPSTSYSQSSSYNPSGGNDACCP